ncbi:MAG: CpsD/CapB family tyrosine-protein kinase [Desulfobacula sp.]|jgi:protein-tyrosine kinase|nr:CpsD/CapB family tyrosine-protein kinase [Desulfobacula sp.]
MEDINWQDPFEKDSLEENSSQNDVEYHYSSSDSLADQFLQKPTKFEEKPLAREKKASTFTERYLQSSSKQTTIQPRPAEKIKKESVYQKLSIHKGERDSFADWKFLDLKNRKQTGDLYKKILHFNKKNGAKAFCFTCSRGREGVSTILANLTDYIRNQATDKTIMVIDANFQNPNLHTIFNVPANSHNLNDVLNNGIDVREALTYISSNIFALICGKASENKTGNLEPDHFVKLLNECRQLVDYVLIDCPPVLSSSDSLSIAPAADISFLTIQSVKVQRPVAQKAISLLQDNECKIGGIVLNRVQQVIPQWVYKFI